MLKEMLLRKMLEKQLKDVPEDQREVLLRGFQNNPKLFETIAREVQAEMKTGKDQMAATMEVVRRHQGELEKIMQ